MYNLVNVSGYLCEKKCYIQLILLEKYSGALKIKTVNGKRYIWDVIRKKWLVLQPEEFVRQIFILYLIDHQYPKGKIAIERKTGLEKKSRFDILVYDEDIQPFLLVECKSFERSIAADVDIQLGSYNVHLHAPYIGVTNGKTTIFSRRIAETSNYDMMEDLPQYPWKK